jgi:hypothetical protein
LSGENQYIHKKWNLTNLFFLFLITLENSVGMKNDYINKTYNVKSWMFCL